MRFKQTFTNKKKELRYNKVTKTLDEVGEIDLQEQINSNMQLSIDELFDKLLYTKEQKKEIKEKTLRREYEEKTDIAQRALDELNNVKTSLGLDLSANENEVATVIAERRKVIDKKVKEIAENAKKDKQKSEQENV